MPFKIVFHSPAHHKNTNGLIQMCRAFGIDLELTHSFERIKKDDYDILILNQHFVEPLMIPSRIKIIYGPQLFVFPEGGIVGPLDPKCAERTVFNTLSKWNTVRLLEDAYRPLRSPCVEFPFAVDIGHFHPGSSSKDIDCIVYIKDRKREIVDAVLQTIQEKKLNYKVYKYGSYREEDYLRDLRASKWMVVVDRHESQGFALEEAMSCNVPLLVLDVASMYDECPDGIHATYESYKPLPLRATSVPYWSDECGIRITSETSFSRALDQMIQSYTSFTPRKYVERELSPAACMRRILDYFQIDIHSLGNNS